MGGSRPSEFPFTLHFNRLTLLSAVGDHVVYTHLVSHHPSPKISIVSVLRALFGQGDAVQDLVTCRAKLLNAPKLNKNAEYIFCPVTDHFNI